MNYFIGVDPGVSGSIAILETLGRNLVDYYSYDMVEDLKVLSNLIIRIRRLCWPASVFVEQVSSWKSSSKIFKFGKSAGALEMGFRTNFGPIQMVRPQVWQEPLGLLRKDKQETDVQKKNRHKELAVRLFPGMDVVHGNADALLIAYYGFKYG